jgi:hypothetical protein
VIAWPVLGVQVYEDRRINGLGRAWPSVVATLGPIAYPFYIRERRKLVAALEAAAPPDKRVDGSALEPGASPRADWYPDPAGKVRLRYWDGRAWTHHGAR